MLTYRFTSVCRWAKPRTLTTLVLLSIGAGGLWPVSDAAEEGVREIAIAARLGRLQNVTATFETSVTTDFDPAIVQDAPDSVQKGIAALGLNRIETERTTFRFLDGSVKVQSERVKTERDIGVALTPEFHIISLTPHRVEEADRREAGRPFSGIIRTELEIPPEWTIDVALGLRLYGEKKWLNDEDLKRAQVSEQDNGIIVYKLSGSNDTKHELTFDKALGYALTRYRVIFPEADTFEEITNTEFKLVDGIYFPHSIVRMNTYRDSTKKLRHPFTRSITIREVKIDDPANTASDIQINWPAGSQILDSRTNIHVASGPTTRRLTDADIEGIIKEQEENKHAIEQRAKDRINSATEGDASQPMKPK